jgi:hypothetical protein
MIIVQSKPLTVSKNSTIFSFGNRQPGKVLIMYRNLIVACAVLCNLLAAMPANAQMNDIDRCRQRMQHSSSMHLFMVLDGSTSMQHLRAYRTPIDEPLIILDNLSMMEPPRWTRKVFANCSDAVQFLQEQEIEGGGCEYIAFVDNHKQFELKIPEMRDLCPK